MPGTVNLARRKGTECASRLARLSGLDLDAHRQALRATAFPIVVRVFVMLGDGPSDIAFRAISFFSGYLVHAVVSFRRFIISQAFVACRDAHRGTASFQNAPICSAVRLPP